MFEDFEAHLLAMEAVPQPHENWKSMLLAGRVEGEHVAQFAAILGSIHRMSAEAGDELRAAFDDRSFFESLRVEPYYEYTAKQVPEAAEGIMYALLLTTGRACARGKERPKVASNDPVNASLLFTHSLVLAVAKVISLLYIVVSDAVVYAWIW